MDLTRGDVVVIEWVQCPDLWASMDEAAQIEVRLLSKHVRQPLVPDLVCNHASISFSPSRQLSACIFPRHHVTLTRGVEALCSLRRLILFTMSSKPKSNPFALEDTLRDLALLRASDLDLSSLLTATTSPKTPVQPEGQSEVDISVELSYEFAREARKAIKIQNREGVDVQGERVEEARSKLEGVLHGLEDV